MTFTQAIATCISKYAVFSGRAQRAEYWWFILFSWLASVLLNIIELTIVGAVGGFPIMSIIFSLALFLPSLGVAVRRLHDTGRSGWWIFIILVPFVGFILLIYWYASRGDFGANQYGNDPIGDEDDGNNGGGFGRSRVPTVER